MGSKERFFYEITSLNPEVTGSCHLVTVHYPDGRQTNFIVDCGLFQEKDHNYMNDVDFPFRGEHIEFALITHNHADHMGRLPHLVRSGFFGNIYTTEETARMMPAALKDSYKIMREKCQKHNEKCPYDEVDLVNTIERIQPCEFGQAEYVDRNIKVTFFMNGHLLGASIILVQISYPDEDDINLIFTGDYKPYNMFFEVEDMPKWVYKLSSTVITEATYGYMDTTDVKYHMELDLEEHIKAGNTVLISVFAQGRAQECLYLLKGMQYRKEIDTNIPIWLDGNLSHEYTRMYASSELLIDNAKEDFLPRNFGFVTKENREQILNYQGQQIILTTSGMLDHGPARLYLERFVWRKNVLIYIPGYTSPDTLGYKLQHPDQKGMVFINGKEHAMRAEVITTNECSSHAKADEIIEFLQRFKNLNLVLINHGQKEVKQQFAERVIEEVKRAKRVEILGEHTFRVSRYGYMKQMGSKWIIPKPKDHKKGDRIKKEKKTQKCKKSFFKRRGFKH